MTNDKLREVLRDYHDAFRDMERGHVAITVLEGMNTREATTAINVLKRGQQRILKRMDAAEVKITGVRR